MLDFQEEEKSFEAQEEEARIPDDLFEVAMANSFDAFMITTAEKGFPIVFINKAFTEITGYQLSECMGKSPSFLQGPKTDPAVLRRLSENSRKGEPFHGEAVNYRKDGTEFIMEWKVLPFVNSFGKITHYFAIQRDVTSLRNFQISHRVP
jgi:PAS domain S-box-containing protein